jgi:hypothetical protein
VPQFVHLYALAAPYYCCLAAYTISYHFIAVANVSAVQEFRRQVKKYAVDYQILFVVRLFFIFLPSDEQ